MLCESVVPKNIYIIIIYFLTGAETGACEQGNGREVGSCGAADLNRLSPVSRESCSERGASDSNPFCIDEFRMDECT